MNRFIKTLTLFFLSNVILSQDVNFYIKSSKTIIYEDEKFTIEFITNSTPQKLIPPNFQDFDVLMGPSQSSSVYTQIINGKVSTEKKVTYTYTLRPKKKGKLIVEQASIYADGKYYKSQPLEITVLDESKSPRDLNSPTEITKQNLHFVVELSKNKIYIGEPLIATYKLYFNNQINSPNIASLPSFDGFISSEINLNNERQTSKGSYKGQYFNEYVLKQYVLTPNKSGNIKLDPFKLDINVEIPTGKVDWFGRNYVTEHQITLKTDTKYIEVLPLPTQGKPENFTGAVGDFSLRMDTDKKNLNANESIQLKLVLSGNGNIDLINIPEPFVPSEIEKYDPKEKRDIKKTQNGISGTITKDYLIVPRYKGIYKIPSIEFYYFSLKEKKYKKIITKDLEINVEKGAEKTNSNINENNITFQEKSKVEYLTNNRNISYIKSNTYFIKIEEKTALSVNNYLFYLLFTIPFLSIFIFVIIENRKEKEAEDILGTRKKKASKIIKKRLKIAKEKLENNKNKEFYEELENALLKFISDKFYIPISSLSKEKMQELFLKKNIDRSTIDDFFKIIDTCQMAKYAPYFNIEDDKNAYEHTFSVIEKINKIS